VGTLLRAAWALGPAHVALAPGCADPLSPKALRASMGAVFHVPLVELADAPPATAVALAADAGTPLSELPLEPPLAFLLGAERAGLPAGERAAAPLAARIPQAAGADSLNVAMAGTVALYELRRRGAQGAS
jgi:TrmH family RNA methyltransferase